MLVFVAALTYLALSAIATTVAWVVDIRLHGAADLDPNFLLVRLARANNASPKTQVVSRSMPDFQATVCATAQRKLTSEPAERVSQEILEWISSEWRQPVEVGLKFEATDTLLEQMLKEWKGKTGIRGAEGLSKKVSDLRSVPVPEVWKELANQRWAEQSLSGDPRSFN